MRQIITLVIVLVIITGTKAQSIKHQNKWEKFRSEKIAFLTSALELSPEEAQKFWPVYNKMEKERWEAQKLRREMGEKVRDAEESLSDKEITQLTRKFAGSMQKEADILVSYNEKFLKILPPEKVLKLYKAENEFRMYMIKKFRDKHKNDR
jgi:hypothetical protein